MSSSRSPINPTRSRAQQSPSHTPSCSRIFQLREGISYFSRSDGSVQVGCSERPSYCFTSTSIFSQKDFLCLLRMLHQGSTITRLQHCGLPASFTLILRELQRCGLLLSISESHPRVHFHGSGPLSTGLRHAFEQTHYQVSATCEETLHRDIPEFLPQLVVLTDRIAPDPSVIHQLLLHQIPHLPVRFVDGNGLIGPLVLPGHTGCLWCIQQFACSQDALRSETLSSLGSSPGQAHKNVLHDVLTLASLQIRHAAQFLQTHTHRPRCTATNPLTLGAVLEVGYDGVLHAPQPAPSHPHCAFQGILPHHSPLNAPTPSVAVHPELFSPTHS